MTRYEFASMAWFALSRTIFAASIVCVLLWANSLVAALATENLFYKISITFGLLALEMFTCLFFMMPKSRK